MAFFRHGFNGMIGYWKTLVPTLCVGTRAGSMPKIRIAVS